MVLVQIAICVKLEQKYNKYANYQNVCYYFEAYVVKSQSPPNTALRPLETTDFSSRQFRLQSLYFTISNFTS